MNQDFALKISNIVHILPFQRMAYSHRFYCIPYLLTLVQLYFFSVCYRLFGPLCYPKIPYSGYPLRCLITRPVLMVNWPLCKSSIPLKMSMVYCPPPLLITLPVLKVNSCLDSPKISHPCTLNQIQSFLLTLFRDSPYSL